MVGLRGNTGLKPGVFQHGGKDKDGFGILQKCESQKIRTEYENRGLERITLLTGVIFPKMGKLGG